MTELIRALVEDLRYEHLFQVQLGRLDQRKAEEAVWRFISRAHLEPDTDLLRWFAESYSREPKSTHCFFPVEHLAVTDRFEVGGATLMRPDDPEVPDSRWFRFPPEGCRALVSAETTGTHTGMMTERAKATAEHALRLLRVGLRQHSTVAYEQLRFRLGHSYVLGGAGGGWGHPPDSASELALNQQLRTVFVGQPLATLPASPTTDIERRALTALAWFDRARLTGDDLVGTLFNFFGLEALLGDRRARLKAPLIAFRRALLSMSVVGHFRDPSVTYWLYEEIRSAAVHGGEPPTVDSREHSRFNWDAWQTLNEFLTFAVDRGLTSRAQVIQELESQPDAGRLLDWLRTEDERWSKFTPGAKEESGHQ